MRSFFQCFSCVFRVFVDELKNYKSTMEREHQKAIQGNLVQLCNELSLEPLVTILNANDIFTDIDLQFIEAEPTLYNKNRKVCMDIKRKGPRAFDIFLKALCDTGQVHLAEAIYLTNHNLRHPDQPQLQNFNDIPVDAQMEEEGGGEGGKFNLFRHIRGKTSGRSPHPGNSASAASGNPVTQPSGEDEPMETGAGDMQQNIAGATNQPSFDSYDGNDSITYKMESDPRGYVLIINNEDFQHMRYRVGSDKDVRALESLFLAHGFEVELIHNQTTTQMKEKLESFAASDCHNNVHSTVVAILSHGVTGAVCGTNSILTDSHSFLSLKDVEAMFTGENCTALAKKPKMFIIQACRGSGEDQGVWVSDDPNSKADDEFAEKLKAERRRHYHPSQADVIFAYATVNEQKAYRNTVTGSPYIQSLCRTFNAYSRREHVADMLTRVTGEMAQLDMSNPGDPEPVKMVPQKTDTLTKRWFLNPKSYTS